MYTAPAYFMTVVVFVTIVLLQLYFKDRVRYGSQMEVKKSKKREAIDDHANAITCIGLSIYDCCILGCMALNVSTKGSIASFETMGISMAESHFDMASARAGTIVASCGTVGVVSLLSMGHLAHFFSDIQLICGGMIVMATGIMSLTTLDDEGGNASWRFILAMFLIYSVGYPIGHTAVIGLFSKSKCPKRQPWVKDAVRSTRSYTSIFFVAVVGRRPQGELLGWFASAGSLARLVFPIASGYIATYSGITTLFFGLTGILIVSTAISLYFRQTLSFLSS